MALHVRGVVLPDDEVRDLWLVGDRVTLEPVPARDRRPAGSSCPAWSTRTATSASRPAAAPIDVARRGPDAGRRRPRRRGAGDPGRRLAVPVPGTRRRPRRAAPGPRRPARRAAQAVPARHRRRGRRGRRSPATVTGAGARPATAGSSWSATGSTAAVGDLAPAWDAGDAWPPRSTPRTPPGPGWRCTRSPRRRSATWCGPASTRSSTAPGCPIDLIDEMARRGTALVPTMINVATFGDIAARARGEVPRRTPRTCSRCATGSRRWCAAAYEAGVPIYVGTDAGGGDRARAGRRGDAAAARAGRDVRRRRAARPASWGAREWLGFPGLVEGGLADLVVYDEDPRADLRVVRAPRRDRPARPRRPLTACADGAPGVRAAAAPRWRGEPVGRAADGGCA